jgi:gliding motility-associated-like protein
VSLKALVDYSPSVGDNYEWIKDSTVIVSSASDSYTILCADSADAGTYYCVITNSQLPKLTLHRRVAILAVQRLANAGASYHVCDSSTSLQGVAAPAGGSQSWSLVSGGAAISYPDSAVTAVTSLSIGANVFQYSVSAGNISCPAGTYSTALLTVTRDTNPAPAYAGANFSVCGPQALLSADSPSVGTGTWTVISLGAATVAQPNDPVTAVNSLSSGVNIFRWQIVNGACAPAYFSEVKVFRDDTLTTVSAGSDTSICATSYVLASQLPADTRWAWSVAAGTGIFSADSSGQVFENDTTVTTPVSGLSEGLNTYTWTVSNSCNSVSASVHVTVYNFTMANAGPNEQLFYSPIHTYPVGDTVAVGTGGTGQYSYVWSPATNIDSTGTEHPDFLTPGAGVYTYSVTVTDGHGCTASSSVTYTVVQEVSLTVPTLFTPNGDGVNDLLYIPGIESYPGNELTVVDRNDQLVYKKTGYANDWGGINELGFSRQGQLLPADTYYYTLKLEDGKALQRGFFLIKY